jgi:hypothetical protein
MDGGQPVSAAGRWTFAAVAAASALAGGCAGQLKELRGDRVHEAWLSPDAAVAGQAEVPATFLLRNPGLGTVLVESIRTDIGTEVSTEPPLPAKLGTGKSLEVNVIARFRAADGDASRRVLLETRGQESLGLSVGARWAPKPPSDVVSPESLPVAGPRAAG